MLKGRKVVIREKAMADAADDYAWRSDDELARLDATIALKLPFEHFLTGYADEIGRSSSKRKRFAIDTVDGKHIGNCMYYNVDKWKGEAEVGIMIGERGYWDKGYGTDALFALIQHIFETTNIDRVYLNTLEWNTRAQRCFEKCGFIPRKRVRRYNGTFVLMEVYRSAWLKHVSSGADLAVK